MTLRNPDAVRFDSAAKAERAALAARSSVLADPNFRRWFGESKVVDAQGKPMVVYHATRADFSVFRTKEGEMGAHFGQTNQLAGGDKVVPVYLRINNPLRLFDHGEWRTDTVIDMLGNAGVVSNSEREKIEKKFGCVCDEHQPPISFVQDLLREKGYDGIVYLNRAEGIDDEELDDYLIHEAPDDEFKACIPQAGDAWIVFDPTQIKSATANNGDYDGDAPDIRHNPRRRALSRRALSRRAPANPRPRKALRRNPEDRGYVRDLLARLQEFKENVMEAADVDPHETPFDPMEYPIDDTTMQAYLDAPVLGWGASRVVVLLPSGNVAKLPWSDAYESNEREWENWQQASEEVQAMLLPPLEYVSGVLVFPCVKTVHDRDYDDPELAAARARWRELWSAAAPGANAQDFQNTQNWGIYDGRVVLIDYAE